MADKPIGTMFVELDLDASRYTKGQQQLLKDAQSTTLNIEQNFKNLGIKSSAEMDLMRAKIQNSFERIANSSKATANDIIRAEEAKNSKLQALNEQQFGRQAGIIETLKKNWIAAGAVVAAVMVTVNKAIASMDEGAKAMQIESSFKIMADSAGVNSERMIDSMKAATRETIDDSAMMQKAIKLLTLEYNPEQIERFSKVVITASQIAGTTAAQAYDELADAIANRMPKSLVRMGAATKDQMEIVNKAIEAGADSMVLYELAMANLELKQKMLQGTQDEALITLQRLHTQVGETTEAIGKGLILAIDYAYRGFEYLAAGVLGLVSAYARYRELIYKVMGDEKQAADNRFVADVAYEARLDLLKRSGQGILDNAAVEKRASSEEIAAAKEKVAVQVQALKVVADAKKKDEEAARKAEAARKKFEEDYRTATMSEPQAAIAKAEAEYKVYQAAGVDKIRLEEWYAGEILKIDGKVWDERQKLIDETVELKKKADEKTAKDYEDSWVKQAEGVNRATMLQVEEYEKANKKMLDLSEETAKAMQSNFSNFFFDMFTGKLKTLQDYATAVFQSLSRMVSDLLSQQLTRGLFGNEMKGGGLLSMLGIGNSGGIGQIGGAMTSSQLSASQLPINTLQFQPFHSGGIVGSEGGHFRQIPAAVFANAPRYHDGIGPGERPAILRDDEGVFTPGQMKALGPRGGGGDTYHFYSISAMDSQGVAEALERSGAVPALAAKNFMDNGILRQVMRGE